MILDLNHKKLNVYQVSRVLIKECYVIAKLLPDDERHNLKHQIKRAASSIILNLAEGSSRRSSLERLRYFEIARGSIIEIDSALQVAYDLGFIKNDDVVILKPIMNQCFAMFSKMMKTLEQENR